MHTVRWKIVGEAANGSSGGQATVFAHTDNASTLPDIDEALRRDRGNQYEWYTVHSVTQVDGKDDPIGHE